MPKKKILNDLIHRSKDLKNHNDQRVAISSQNLCKNSLKTIENFSNESDIKINDITKNTTNHLHHASRVINNSEKINLKKFNKNKQNYDFSNDEEESKE